MNQPRVYMCPHPELPFPSHPSGLSQYTSFECPVSCLKLGLVIYFTYDNILVLMLFSKIIPPSPSPTESKVYSLYLCLFCCLTYRVIDTIFLNFIYMRDFPGASDGEASCLQCGRPRFDPWVGKILWKQKWQPTPVLLPGKSHGWRSLVGYSPWGCRQSDTTEQLHCHFHTVLVFFFLAYFTLYNRLQFHPPH